MAYDLAQVNIARLRAPLDDASLREFVDALEPVNALADDAPGFRWRLQTEDGNATAITGFEDERGDGAGVIVNMSTWADIDSLAAFVFGPLHLAIMRRRREWFLPMAEAYTACWWVPAGYRPTVADAEARVALLRRTGPSRDSFTLKRHFPSPEGADGPATDRADWRCPA